MNPTEDMPSCEEHSCDIGGCYEPWAGEVERDNGPRRLRLCEAHYDLWTRSEREFLAELEAVRGQKLPSPGTFKAIERRYGKVGT